MALRLAEGRDPALAKRTISAAVLVAIALASLWLGGWPFALFAAVVAVALGWEWAGLFPGHVEPRWLLPALIIPAPVMAVLLAAGGDARMGILLLVIAAVLASAILGLMRRPGADHAGLGIVYLGIAASSIVWIDARPDHGGRTLLWLMLVVWATDIFAYLVGRSVGGPKLAPRVSPGKTWSGLAGGVIGAAIVASLAGAAMGGRAVLLAAIGMLLAVVSQIGDLFESFLKRRAGVKDSGHLIPGHGGVLDRLDGLMLAAPVFALLIAAAPAGTLP
jgi:phosphatidate cytidylyltransferase